MKKKPAGWNAEAQKAFEELKELCCSAPSLAYANYQKKFKIQTDASDLGLGSSSLSRRRWKRLSNSVC